MRPAYKGTNRHYHQGSKHRKLPQAKDITVLHRYYPPSGEIGDHSVGLLADTAVELAYKILAREGAMIPARSNTERLPGYSVDQEPER